MDAIFFERQEGQLCAQHCLNNLLQGPIFTAVDLAGHAEVLDAEERATMAEGGVSSPEFLRFMQQPSHNMDDSGHFSVQVIAKALCVWNLQLESLTSPHMKTALDNPTSQQAFICNHESHWLTIRRLGQQWFNLNSLLKKPELISDTYLSLFLHQLQMEGYSIFVVVGVLPPCEADQVLSLIRAEPPPPSRPVPSSSFSSSSWQEEHHQHTSRGREKRPGPQTFSSVLSGSGRPAKRGRGEDKGEKQDLQMAMALSATLEQSQEQFEIDQQLQFQRPEKGAEGTHPAISSRDEVGDYAEEDEEEEAALAAAIYASLEDDRMRQTGHSTAAAAHTKKQGPLHTAGPGSGPEMKTAVEKGDGGEEPRKPGWEKSEAKAEHLHPSSQEELRERRLKYLGQKKS